MTTTKEITQYDDMFDSRDVIERLEFLEEEMEILKEECNGVSFDPTGDYQGSENVEALLKLTDEEKEKVTAKLDEWEYAEEYKFLCFLRDEFDGYCDDWKYGVTIIRDTYFEEYAEELANDVCEMPKDLHWPFTCIDWEQAAKELQQDYTSADYEGVTWWAR